MILTLFGYRFALPDEAVIIVMIEVICPTHQKNMIIKLFLHEGVDLTITTNEFSGCISWKALNIKFFQTLIDSQTFNSVIRAPTH